MDWSNLNISQTRALLEVQIKGSMRILYANQKLPNNISRIVTENELSRIFKPTFKTQELISLRRRCIIVEINEPVWKECDDKQTLDLIKDQNLKSAQLSADLTASDSSEDLEVSMNSLLKLQTEFNDFQKRFKLNPSKTLLNELSIRRDKILSLSNKDLFDKQIRYNERKLPLLGADNSGTNLDPKKDTDPNEKAELGPSDFDEQYFINLEYESLEQYQYFKSNYWFGTYFHLEKDSTQYLAILKDIFNRSYGKYIRNPSDYYGPIIPIRVMKDYPLQYEKPIIEKEEDEFFEEGDYFNEN